MRPEIVAVVWWRPDQIDFEDHPVIDDAGVGDLPQGDGPLADPFREALFHQLVLLLTVVGEGPSDRERISRKESLDVDLFVVSTTRDRWRRSARRGCCFRLAGVVAVAVFVFVGGGGWVVVFVFPENR